MNFYVLAVCAGLVLLTAGSAFAGGKEAAPYRCVVDGKKVEDCMLGCKTKEICAKEEEALKALSEASELTFYSLTGWGKGDFPQGGVAGYEVVEHKILEGDLAHLVAYEFLRVLDGENYSSGCFDPRHALIVETEAHMYDYLLCFACGKMAIYEDGEYLSRIETQRDAEVLNALMVKAGMTIPAFYAEQAEE